ncbi:MAG: N-6 DNA methylase [bacterium]
MVTKQINDSSSFSAKQAFSNIRNYLAGRFVGATRDDVLLNEVIKFMFCEFRTRNSDIENYESEELFKLYKTTFNTIKTDFPQIFESKEDLLLDPASMKYLHDQLQNVDIFNIQRDPIGDVYEMFIGENIKGKSGQFFTPRNATDLLVSMVEPKPGDKIIDPACGSGGFLSSVLKFYLEKQYSKKEISSSLNNLVGIDKDSSLVRLARIHIALLTNIMPNIYCADSLGWNTSELGPKENSYDIVLTNPPFGANINAASDDTLELFDLGYKWRKKKGEYYKTDKLIKGNVPPQVLFMEQCIKLTKPYGKIGIVTPESLVSTNKYKHVVEYIKEKCIINGVIGMPESLFKTSGKGGTHTKTVLLSLTKKAKKENKSSFNKIFFSEAKWCGHDSRGKEIPKDDLPNIKINYEDFLNNAFKKPTSHLGYLLDSSKIENNILAPRYYDPKIKIMTNELDKTHHLVKIQDLIDNSVLSYSTGDEVGKLAYGTGEIPFVRTSDISNWEIKVDPKHSINRKYYEELKEKQDVQPGDLLMVKDGDYLIGTCAYVTEYDTEIVYQSHIYKLRIKENNEFNLNPYLLLAILSSSYVQSQIKAKTMTQDIINSLGRDRYINLILAIPKNREKREHITSIVKKSISDRVEARELSRKAVVDVLN